MTNYIEKLYELAKVEKIQYSGVIQGDFPMRFHDVGYPPFTDTKQLELNKWISSNTRYMWNYIGETIKNTWVFEIEYTDIFKFKSCEHTDFSQALAGLVCELWEDLTDTQREEVRGILQ